ncbi:hypothetical protein BDZ45DRAFT_800429 [Acephala macrosclerotiorum]|nr:hypothetical protein BDZ45DRAFT_800429 [Acephala macrosclerotiorum]
MTLFVTIHVSPENTEKFKERIDPFGKHVLRRLNVFFLMCFGIRRFRGGLGLWRFGEQLTKPYYASLWVKSMPLLVEEAKMEYFEREGEGSIWSDEYLAGGRKMEKTQVVA